MRPAPFQSVTHAGLIIEAVKAEPNHLRLVARPRAPDAACPGCGQRSRQVHSHYDRRLLDLPSHRRAAPNDWRASSIISGLHWAAVQLRTSCDA